MQTNFQGSQVSKNMKHAGNFLNKNAEDLLCVHINKMHSKLYKIIHAHEADASDSRSTTPDPGPDG